MGHPVLWDFVNAVEGDEEEVDGQGHPEGEEYVRDVEAGVKVGADAGGESEGGVEASSVRGCCGGDSSKEADAEGVGGEEQGQDGEGERYAGGPVMDAEEMHGGGGHPVHERGFVEEADAVDVRRDVVVAEEHLAGDLDVDGVNVVEEAGGEEAADLKDEPGEDEDGEGAWAPETRGGGCRRGDHGMGFGGLGMGAGHWMGASLLCSRLRWWMGGQSAGR